HLATMERPISLGETCIGIVRASFLYRCVTPRMCFSVTNYDAMSVTGQHNISVTVRMTALLEFECRPAVGGYKIVQFDPRHFKWATPRDDPVPTEQASDDERYIFSRWGRMYLLPEKGLKYRGELRQPEVRYWLLPLTERTKRFDLFSSGPSAFLEFAQATTLEALTAHTRGDSEAFHKDLKCFADKYDPLQNEDLAAQISYWWVAIMDFRRALAAWAHAQQTGDFEKLIRALERRQKFSLRRSGPPAGTQAYVLLANDERNRSARLCIRPPDLISAMY